MDRNEENKIRTDLMQCKTIGEIFNYLSNYFDLFSKSIPVIYKPIVVTAVIQAIKWINPIKK